MERKRVSQTKPIFKPNINGNQDIPKNLEFPNSFKKYKTHVIMYKTLPSEKTCSIQNYL